MRSVLSNLVFFLGFGLGLLIAGYFLLRGGIYDVMENYRHEPNNWLGIILGLLRAAAFVVAAFVAFWVAATVAILIGEDDWWLRRTMMKWQDRADAKWLRKNRTKMKS